MMRKKKEKKNEKDGALMVRFPKTLTQVIRVLGIVLNNDRFFI